MKGTIRVDHLNKNILIKQEVLQVLNQKLVSKFITKLMTLKVAMLKKVSQNIFAMV